MTALTRAVQASINATHSQVEWELVKVHIAGDGSDLGSEASNLVGKHARCRDLDRIVPVVVVVAESVSEVENGSLRDFRRILGYIEMSWFHGALSYGMGN